MNSNLIMEIPEINDLVATFVSVMKKHTNKGIIKIGNYKMESKEYTAGNDQGHWKHNVIYIRRTYSWKTCGIIIWWQVEFNSPHTKINLKHIKRHYDEIKKVVDQISETYQAKAAAKEAARLSQIERKRQTIKRLWEKH